jgi:hypothetical protein
MTFLNPILVSVGLGCVAIPIIIHILMRRRRRPIKWGAMKFLMEAYRRQRRRMNLEQLLLLASRCLLVALLALALGKPVLGAVGLLAQGPRTLFVLIDNGLASSAVPPAAADNKPALERSKSAALDLISKLDQGKGDRVAVITLAGPADALVIPPTPDLSAASELIKSIHPLDSKADIPGGLLKVRDELRRDPSRAGESTWIAMLSDFRAGSAPMDASVTSLGQGETSPHLILQTPADAPLDNISITSIEPARSVLLASSDGSPTTSTPVRVSLHRSGPGVRNTAVTKVALEAAQVLPNGGAPSAHGPRAEVTVNWPAGKDAATADLNVEVPVQTGAGMREQGAPLALVATIDKDAIANDDVSVRPIETRDRLEVALLASGAVGGKTTIDTYTPADWLALALAPEADLMRRRQGGEIRVTVIDPARALTPVGSHAAAGILGDFDAILIPYPQLIDAQGWRLVRGAADLGALILISPPPTEQTHLWTDSMVEGLGLDWSIGREAKDLKPGVSLSLQRPTPSGADLLSLLSAELPELVKHVDVSKVLTLGPSNSYEPLLTLADGTPLLIMGQAGSNAAADRSGSKPISSSRGLILFLTAAPDLKWTDLPTKPLMVPLMQELVRQGVGRSEGPRVAVAGSMPSLPPGASELALIPDPNASDHAGPSSIPVDQAGRPGAVIRTHSLWSVRSVSGNSLGVVAFNADPQGGLTDTRTREELAHWLAPVSDDITWLEAEAGATPAAAGAATAGAAFARDNKIPPISLPLLGTALAIAALETCLARWFSHAKADAGLLKIHPVPEQTQSGMAA